MKQNSRTGSRLFFIEFLIVLFFFLIISTVCLRLFAQAHSITRRSEALSHAQAAASSVAAVIEERKDAAFAAAVTGEEKDAAAVAADDAAAGLVENAASYFPDASVTGDGFFISYDQNFDPCPAEKAVYTLTLTLESADQEISADIVVQNYDHSVLYELPVSFYIPMTREEALQ